MPSMDQQYCYHDYDTPDPCHQELYLLPILEQLKASGNVHTILDAGCGDGNFAASLATNGYQVYGIDLSAGGVRKAIQRRIPTGAFAVASVYDDFGKIFPERNYFDAVIGIEVIEHLYSPRAFVQRTFDALRPGGLAIVTTPYWGYFKNIVLAITGRMDRALTALWDGGHIKHWSYPTLKALFEEMPFEFVAFRGIGRPIPFVWKGMLMVFRKKSQ